MNTPAVDSRRFWGWAEGRKAKADFLAMLGELGYFRARTLDYGCGDQPFRGLVDGEYVGYDPLLVMPAEPILAPFGFIICTDVLQFCIDPSSTMKYLASWLEPDGGRLVITYPCNMPLEEGQLWQFAPAGIHRLIRDAGLVAEGQEPLLGADYFSLVAKRSPQ